MIVRTVLAFVGTIAFALLFGVPRKYFISCGCIGGAGWLLYEALMAFAGATATEATFFATVLVILLSRLRAVRARCPVTVFLISGIFPLVPGVPFTNGIRDIADGDYISGAVRLLDAILVFLCIAIGVGVMFTVYQRVAGGVLL